MVSEKMKRRIEEAILSRTVDNYRAWNKGMQISLSDSQAGPGRTVKQEQEESSRNHIQAFIPGSVVLVSS